MNFLEIPKVELHCHLEACFRPGTVMEIGKSLGLDIPQDAQRFHDDWLLSRPLQDLETALKRFADIQKLWCSEEIIERLTFEACEDAVAQGIRIMEFRYAPDFIRYGSEHLELQQIHDAILRGLSRAPDNEIAIGLIGIVQKTLPLKEAEKTVDFIIENALTFVALDFADQDTHPLSAYAPLVEKARKAKLHLTVHAGEVPGPDAPGEVISAIEDLGAERIGHGIHIINDQAAMDIVRERNVALEVCPTSNYLTSSVTSTAEHPIRRLMESGIPLTINSDDPGLFGIDLCHEYEILHREHGFSSDDFDRCNDIAAAQSFLPLEQKRRVWPREIDATDPISFM
ncbi:MAG: adenosine deaminase [Halioglobus sp.]|jgi:adenosine deaminase